MRLTTAFATGKLTQGQFNLHIHYPSEFIFHSNFHVSHSRALQPMSTWIEHGSDGRPYLVRKRIETSPVPPRHRTQVGWLFPDIKRHLRLFSRQPKHYPVAALSSQQEDSERRALTAPPSSFEKDHKPQRPFPPRGSNTTQPQPPAAQAQYKMHPWPPQGAPTNDNNAEKSGILKYQPQQFTISQPQPQMCPVVMPLAPQNTTCFGPQETTMMLAQPPNPFSMSQVPTFPPQPPPIGAHSTHVHRPPTAEDMKYRCASCGRFRSTRYHYKHPIPPGQLPGRTICRKCQEAATDTEDESSDSVEYIPIRRQRARSQSQARSIRCRGSTNPSRHSREPPSRRKHSERDDRNYHTGEYPDSPSSLEFDALQITESDRHRPYKSASRRELAQFVEHPIRRRPSIIARTVYVDNRRDRGIWLQDDGIDTGNMDIVPRQHRRKRCV